MNAKESKVTRVDAREREREREREERVRDGGV